MTTIAWRLPSLAEIEIMYYIALLGHKCKNPAWIEYFGSTLNISRFIRLDTNANSRNICANFPQNTFC